MEKVKLLSFIIPCYRSEETIEAVVDEIIQIVSKREGYDYEIICVNDESPDHVYDVLCKISGRNEKIRVLNLAKNVGKHSAVLAGCKFAKGEFVVFLDDDFQCPVQELWKLLEPLENDECDVATASYREKKQARWKNIGSEINLLMSSVMLGKPRNLRFENFFAAKRFVVKKIVSYKRPYPYLEGLLLQVTHRIIMVKMDERERADGKKTGFTFYKSLSLWINGFTAFSVKPLRVSIVIGFLASFGGFCLGIYMIVKKLSDSFVPVGYTSLIAVQLFTSGVIMMILGLVGEYVGRIYISLNNFPQYVIRETINIDNLAISEQEED